MNGPDILQTVLLSMGIGLISTLANLPAAIAVSWLLTRSKIMGKSLLDGLINLPLVMPPVTIGYVLLLILGKKGPVGSVLFNLFGIRIAFTTAAAVIASMVVSFPLIAGNIKASLEMSDKRLEKAARTLGAGKLEVFFRITFPLILPGIISGAITGFARSLGEFGATMTFAGNIQGTTRTIPLSVYSWLQIPGKERESAILVCISILISFLAMLLSGICKKRIRKRSKTA